MNIQNINGQININIDSSASAKLIGKVFEAKILSIKDNIAEMILPQGEHISASIKGNVNIPLNETVSFQIISNDDNVVSLRLLPSSSEFMEDGTGKALLQLSSTLGINISIEGTETSKFPSTDISSELSKLYQMLQQDGKSDVAAKLSQAFVDTERINDYIKWFPQHGMENIINNLNDLIKSIDMSKAGSSKYVRVFQNIIDGLSIQNSNPFPFFYVPIPIMLDKQIYPGELYVEKREDKEEKNDIYMYLVFDTPSLGKIEVDISSRDLNLDIKIYCREYLAPIFKENIDMLKDNIVSNGINIATIDVCPLKKSSDFISIAQKYIKPYPQIDVRI